MARCRIELTAGLNKNGYGSDAMVCKGRHGMVCHGMPWYARAAMAWYAKAAMARWGTHRFRTRNKTWHGLNIAWYEHSTECKECYYYYYDSEVDDDYYLLPTAIATMTIKTGRLMTRTMRQARASNGRRRGAVGGGRRSVGG